MNELPHPLGPGDKLTGTWISNLLRAVRRMKPLQGPGISTRVTPDGTVISAAVAAPRAAAPLAPFTVRLHKTEDDPDGQWEIYLPPGCCNVGGPCEPLNPPASDTSGHEDDAPAWRSLGSISNWMSLVPEDSTEVDGIQEEQRRVVVEIHVKPSAKEYGVDQLDSPARRLVWASLRDDVETVRRRSYNSLNQASLTAIYKDTPGDIWACDVATITHVRRSTYTPGSQGVTEYTPSINVKQHRTTPVDAAVPQGTGVSNFDLVWYLAVEESTGPFSLALGVKAVYCIRQDAAAAGIVVTGDNMTDIISNVKDRAVQIYARVNVTDLTGGVGIIDVLKDPEGVSVSTPYVVWLPLYALMHNTVTADYRPQSLTNLQLFHA